jgi:crotonobetainyl-CoA:carnitine CoA-transferase CaiB-like acyl-CoA transferase
MPRISASTALSRLRILDFSRVRAGPTCVRQFADFGADVIKIESPPGVDPNEAMGGPRHGPDMQNLHRNKRAMTLNLKLPEAREVLERLVKTGDVVVGSSWRASPASARTGRTPSARASTRSRRV